MKYLLLIYGNPASQEAIARARDQVMAEVDTLMKELAATGELVGGQALAGPAESKTVVVRDGVPAVTDGPFLESKEFLAGYLIVECDSVERATDIAARWPDARLCAMEVRPIINEVTA
ncbi:MULTISPECIES: YciI family protein [Nonomuraea]|uniref:YciI family protein n=1 Tax=Nonomuraea ferruginea TaxID=46174 RepID=A0ABT4TD20_9ACTN|nr:MULTISPECIES: YciI family protein [Nonomuraea]MDA0647134.1 YciI family protein [Nonomuraea ferruginea]TXK41106.1 YciI family protein [Nonomuraea sp. C10]